MNAFSILRYLVSSQPQGVNAIARALSLNPSSCFNLLKTLTGEAFVEFDPKSKTYCAGPAPSWLAKPRADVVGWKKWLRSELEDIAQEYAVTCGLWQLLGKRLVLLDVVDSPLDTRIHLTTGQRLPSHIGAIGRCIAAYEDVLIDDVAQIISELRWQQPPTAAAYWKGVQLARRRGWAIDSGAFVRGVTSVGAAIGKPVERIGYCLSSSLFSGQCDYRRLRDLGHDMASLAADAGRRLRRSQS